MSISIICLTYNRVSLLEECIFSVLNQSYKNFELIVVNDCSQQILTFNHPNVKIFNLENKFNTLGDKRNFAIQQATKDYIVSLDDDDIFLPFYLEVLLETIKNYDWISAQRVIHYRSPVDVRLSKIWLNSTFIYKRNLLSRGIKYVSKNYDELSPFYTEVSKSGRGLYKAIPPNKIGYVYRLLDSHNRKYSMYSLRKESIHDQYEMVKNIPVEFNGNITLIPKWKIDYVDVVNKHVDFSIKVNYPDEILKKSVDSVIESSKKNVVKSNWNSVKHTWNNAGKFISAIKSRGLLSTASDIIGIDKSMGNRVSDEIYEQRKLSCFGDINQKIDSCVNLQFVSEKGYFCSACGCGEKSLARLDADSPNEYTKLHYPQLECPLKKRGFSNEEKVEIIEKHFPLSIIMPALNEDSDYLNTTIKSIRETSGNKHEIIVVDDYSDIPVVCEERVIRNTKRMGTGLSRHIGAQAANHDYLLFTDAHMVFEKGWYENFIEVANPKNIQTAYCGVCLGLSAENRTLETHRGAYYGAQLTLYDEKNQNIIEGKWTKEIKDQDNYEISCMMGAMYFVPKKLYFKVRGFSDLRMWGTLEPCLSTKIWLSGGEIRLLKKVRAGHIFRPSSPYSTGIHYLIYNKIRLAKTIFPIDVGEVLISKLPRSRNFSAACELIEQDKNEIEEYNQYYKSIFSRDIYWLCKKFRLPIPNKYDIQR